MEETMMWRKTGGGRGVQMLAVMLGVIGALSIALAPVASARTSHNYESVITELARVNSMTVFSGDLYVAERLGGEGSRADQFAPSPSEPAKYGFVSQLPQPEPRQRRDRGIAFGTATGETEMYIGQESFPGPPGVDVFAAGVCGELECASLQKLWTGAGAPSPFAEVLGLTVDHHPTALGDWASGDVFVDDSGGEIPHNVIDIFEPVAGGSEKYVGQVTGPSPGEHFGPIEGVTVSGFNGDLVVAAAGTVYVFRPEEEAPKKGKYALVQKLLPPSGTLKDVTAVAVDDNNGEIYVATFTAVYEFGPEGVFRGGITGVPKEGSPAGIKGQTEEVRFNEDTARPVSLAVDPISHRVLVGVFGSQVGPSGSGNEGVVDVFSPDIVVPDVVSEAPANLKLETDPETGAESWGLRPTGTVNPDSAGEASCWFAWGTSPSLGEEAPCSATVHNGSSPVHVHASLSGLAPDTTYYYRLQARNANGVNLGEESQTYSFTTSGPGLRSESVSAVSSQGATLEATISPHDAPSYPKEEHREDLQEPATSPTSYYFQYSTHDTSACVVEPSTCVSVPVSPASVGSGSSDVDVSQPARGLSSSTAYHYRLVAVNEALPVSAPGVLSAFYGQDRTFTTQSPGAPLALPDGRAWELVSPVDKHGARVEGGGQAAVDGGKFAYVVGTPSTSSINGYDGHGNQMFASRVAPGVWANVDGTLSHSSPTGVFAGVAADYRFFSEDLGVGIVESLGPFSVPEGWHETQSGEWTRVVEASPVPTERTPYVRHDTTCESSWSTCYEPLLDPEDTAGGEPYGGDPTVNEGLANFAGATPDGSHAVVGSPVRLTATTAPEGGLYEWSAGTSGTEKLSLVSVLPDRMAAGHVGTGLRAEGLLDLSSDGSRIVFGENGSGGNGKTFWQELYLRDVARGETVALGLTEAGLPTPGIRVFQGASADDSRVYFTDSEALTSGSGTGGFETGGDLYVCEAARVGSAPLRCTLRDLTPVPAAGEPGAHESAHVAKVFGVSADGSYVYFVGSGVQAQGAIPGAENLYVAHGQAGAWTTSFVASAPLGSVGIASAVAPDGEWFAFSSKTSLTGYDNRDAKTGMPDSEVYLYNAISEKLICVSCNSTGARPVGPSEVPGGTRPIPTEHESPPVGLGVMRSLFDNGRLFFDSGDALVPQDTNSNVDVYEFEPAGVPAGENACSSASATFNASTGGCVGLISSGVAFGPSVFSEASGGGRDVFFTTAERLVRKDTDTAVDVYDAHECTSASPCAPPETAAPEECSSAASCRQAPGSQPSLYGAPSSATFSGAGNLTPAPIVAKPTTRKVVKASCRKKRSKRKRVACERKARRRGARVKKSSSARSTRRAGR